MFKHILIPTDGSALSLQAARAGMTLAKALNARVAAMHVVALQTTAYFGELAWIDDRLDMTIREAAEQQGAKYLDQIEAAAQEAHVPCSRALVAADQPWQAIIETAATKQCDLIVMAAHGRRGVSALLLGSETNKVLTHSKIPVLVCR